MSQDNFNYDFDNHTAGDGLRCVSCAHAEPVGADQCSICGGEVDNPPPSMVDFGVDLSAVQGGAEFMSVHRVLSRYAALCHIRFTLGENDLTPEQIFQPEALMPVISIEALRLWQTLSRRPGMHAEFDEDSLEVEFRESINGFFPYSSYQPGIGSDLSSSFRLLVYVLAARRVLGMKEGTKIDLAPFLLEWNKIDWNSDQLPDVPVPPGFDAQFMAHEFTSREGQKEKLFTSEDHTSANPFASQGS